MTKRYEALACLRREEGFSSRTQSAAAGETLAPDCAHLGAATAASAPRGEETVLVVDDEPLIRNLVSYLLQEKGYRVLEAANGVDALTVTREHAEESIDLLVTDLVMPKMGGVELAMRLRAMRPDLRVLFISSDFMDAQKVLAFGGKFLAKPFTLSALTIIVHEILYRI